MWERERERERERVSHILGENMREIAKSYKIRRVGKYSKENE